MYASCMHMIAATAFLATCTYNSAIAQTIPPEAQPKYKAAASEIAQLPKYCYAQYVDSRLTGNPGYSLPGGCGEYMNHFCPGLVNLIRASKATAPKWQRRENLQQAEGNFEYTLSEMSPGCALRRDVDAAKAHAGILKRILK